MPNRTLHFILLGVTMLTCSFIAPRKFRIVLTDPASGNLIDVHNGVRGSGPFTFKLSVTASDTGEIPKDNPYRVTKYTMLLARGARQVAKFEMTGDTADTTTWTSIIQPGDRIVIYVDEVVKKSGDREEKVSMAPVILNIPVG